MVNATQNVAHQFDHPGIVEICTVNVHAGNEIREETRTINIQMLSLEMPVLVD